MKLGLSVCVLTMFLTGCSDSSLLTNIKSKTVKFGQTVGLVEVRTMKKPDYYSTKQLNRNYQFAKEYDLNDLDCSAKLNQCN
ncbi:hypothetical protein [Thiomicrorhabdus sp.]|uniref:hypothetical protein n=1 Tax=Thiomicrorhabdus sp. TaxID=2039724 RepID=UPI002AA6DBBE|nr:hypothetical protein [Thiomicrorhabdus sp.]